MGDFVVFPGGEIPSQTLSRADSQKAHALFPGRAADLGGGWPEFRETALKSSNSWIADRPRNPVPEHSIHPWPS
jgi:hypothetical protein